MGVCIKRRFNIAPFKSTLTLLVVYIIIFLQITTRSLIINVFPAGCDVTP